MEVSSTISPTAEPRLDEFKNRRLREATKYVGRGWLPASPLVFKRLHDKLHSTSIIGLDDIQSEIKSDIGLFAHCIRKMGTSFDAKGSVENPGDLMRALTLEKLRETFSMQHSEFSPHDLSAARDVQLSRMKHSVITCSTVEVLAGCVDIDRDLAQICAMIRQLGHLLVAWNYPSSCVRAKTNMEASSETFDAELAKLVGFDPSRLGTEASTAWCKNPNFLFGMSKMTGVFNQKSEHADEISKNNATLVQFCEIGEILARINDPEHYPNATHDWKNADEVLRRYLGPKGVGLVREKIEERYPHYVTMAPNLFPNDLSPERAAKTVNYIYARKLLDANPYVRRCPEEMQSGLTEVYNNILQNEPSIAAINTLITKVIPSAGFVSGCVYLLDPSKMSLIPRLFIGGSKLKKLKPVSCSCGGLRSHPVSEAFHCTMPVKQEEVILNGEVVSHVTGKFGTGDKVGILYLEFTDIPGMMLSSENRLMYFKAIRQALNDCLNL